VQATCEETEFVLLLHGSAGTSSIWRGVRDALSPVYRLLSPDLIGYGRAAPWSGASAFSLAEEVRRIDERVLCCEQAFDVVGYSYGGAVAIALALANPARVRTLTLIEPVFFCGLRYAGEQRAFESFEGVRNRFEDALRRGETDSAMRDFIDFWTGAGAWDGMSDELRRSMRSMAGKIQLDWQASFEFDPGPAALRMLGERTLLVRGDRSPEPMRRLVDALHILMPGSGRGVIGGANHLLPLTHATQLSALVAAHLHAASERTLR